MGLFDKAFNKFAESGNKLNKGINKVIGKDVFGEIRPIEAPREFAEYSSFPQYDKEEPGNWSSKQGEGKTFNLSGATITVSKELDTCIQYRKDFAEAASYYTERFKYKYSVCVNDFDTLTHYFKEMYLEGLQPMLYRAYSLLLPLSAESYFSSTSDCLSVSVSFSSSRFLAIRDSRCLYRLLPVSIASCGSILPYQRSSSKVIHRSPPPVRSPSRVSGCCFSAEPTPFDPAVSALRSRLRSLPSRFPDGQAFPPRPR